jgi:hypothetical protein
MATFDFSKGESLGSIDAAWSGDSTPLDGQTPLVVSGSFKAPTWEVRTPPRQCAGCGQPFKDGDTVIGKCSGSLPWVWGHKECEAIFPKATYLPDVSVLWSDDPDASAVQ